jgi:hypothetical protein
MRTETTFLICPDCGSELPGADVDSQLAEAQRKIENLQIALQSSRHIAAAVGILMERMKVTTEEAFDMLVFVSQHEHRKLRDIAEQLLFTGALPDSGFRKKGVGATSRSAAECPR